MKIQSNVIQETVCMVCGSELPSHTGGGRQKQYCSDRCRQHAKRDRDVGKTVKRDGSLLLNTITTGDARELAKGIPDNSVDLVFVDPPYLKKDVEDGIYAWLGQEAERILKPGGFCLTYTSTYWKPQVLAQMGKHLTYFWDYVLIFNRGRHGLAWGKKTIIYYTPLIAYCKGKNMPQKAIMDVYYVDRADKKWHKWGQDAMAVQYFMEYFSKPGDVVADFFCGGGTVPYVCKQLERNFIAFELEPATADIAQKRIETVQPLLVAEKAIQAELA